LLFFRGLRSQYCPVYPTQSLGSTGSLSSANTPNTHPCTRRSGSREMNRSNPSTPRANSLKTSERFAATPRETGQRETPV
jgi:hypothetical protein